MRALQIIAENLIQEAIEKGDFKNLEGQGKPVDLEEYFTIPEAQRMVYTLLKNSDFQNQEVALSSRIEKLRARLKSENEPGTRARLSKLLYELENRLKADEHPHL